MNIVEEFGSYSAALERLNMYGILRTEMMWHKGAMLTKSDLLNWLLVYRKEHGIYWVGDFVVTNDPASQGRCYQITAAVDGYYKLTRGKGRRYCREWRIARHATQAEQESMNADTMV
jgi:hypothetical protein